MSHQRLLRWKCCHQICESPWQPRVEESALGEGGQWPPKAEGWRGGDTQSRRQIHRVGSRLDGVEGRADREGYPGFLG